MKLVTILAFLLLPLSVFPQQQEEDDGEDEYEEFHLNEIDSLRHLIKSCTDDSLLKKYYSGIAKLTQIYDTIFKYGYLALSLCTENDYSLLGQNNYLIGMAYHNIGEDGTALPIVRKSLVYFKKANYLKGIAKDFQLMSYIYDDSNDLDSALYYMTNALEIGNRLQDTALISDCYLDFGTIYGQREFYKESEMYFRKALVLDSLSKNKFQYVMDLFYIVQLIDNRESDSLQEYFLARDYMTKVINVLDTVPSYHRYMAYGTCVSIYSRLAKMTNENKYADSSYYYYKKAEPFFRSSGGLNNYRLFKLFYVDYLLYYKKYDAAINVMRELDETFCVDEDQIQHADFYRKYKDIYLALGDYKNAYFYVEKMHEYERATYNDSTLSALSDVRAQQISMMEKLEREKNEEVHNADKRRLRTLVVALLVVLGLVFSIFWIKNKANKKLSEKNQLLNSQKAEIAIQRDEIASQKDIITEQWHEVETVNNKLLSSINYAKRIQTAAVSSESDVKAVFPDSFVFYRPRDIVSGDFYRCARCGRYSVMVTADCTGHGIPGAFLSMLGLSALKEFMVTEHDAENPGTVLDRIRDFIKTTLVSSDRKLDEGMDMTVCSFDFEQMEMRYAIAQQTAVIVRKGKAIKLTGDPMPVGRHIRDKERFSTKSVKIEKGDIIYSFSDGIQDQLGGGKKPHKYMLRNLLELLTYLSDKPSSEQCAILEQKISDWRGSYPQVDDMTLIGISV